MELNLNFRENEFRDLYEKSYIPVLEEMENYVKGRRRTNLILLVLSGLTFLLTFVHNDWMYYGFIFLFLSLLHTGWAEIKRIKTNRFIERNRKEVDEFVLKTKLKHDIKYFFDNNLIHYYESGQLVDTYQWNDLDKLENHAEYFVLHFSNDKPTIMIPRTMVENKEELMVFENKIHYLLKNAR